MSPSDFPSFDLLALRNRLGTAADDIRSRHWTAVAIGIVALSVGGFWGLQAWTRPPASIPPPISPQVATTTPAATTTTVIAQGDESSTNNEVVVQVAGAVARPGVYRVSASDRVNELIDRAGGATADADVDRMNLAAKIRDGQRVYVVRKGEPTPTSMDVADAPTGTGSVAGSPSAVLDLNSATLQELDALPGIGPATAQAIIDFRGAKGRFRSVDDLANVKGIGPAKLAQLRSRVTV